MSESRVVCVTGASGFISSWLVSLLLDRGYTVNATVKDLKDEKETKHLEALEGAESCLRLFQIDLLDYDSIVAAVTGVSGVFHLASPCLIDHVDDPEDEKETKHLEALEGAESCLRLFQIDLLDYDSIVAAVTGVSGVFHLASPCLIDHVDDPENLILGPAVKGTINVLTAAKELGVKRVVFTSSIASIIPSPDWPSDVVRNEDCWTDVEFCKQKKLWYSLSKTLAEKAAWDFAKEKGLDIVVVNPGTVMGPILPPTISPSMITIQRLIQGSAEPYDHFYMGPVHVKDVALAHILVYENKSATGRHLCVESISHYGDLVAKIAELYPEYNLPKLRKDTQPGLMRSKTGAKKLMDLGLQFIPVDQIVRDAVESMKSKGFIS